MVETIEPTEFFAHYLAGKINKENLDENTQTLIDIFGPGGAMDDDPRFRAKVNAKKEELLTRGEKIPLFTSNELQNATLHKHPKKRKPNHALPEPFWPYVPVGTKRVEIELMADPERNLHNLEKQMNNRFDPHLDTPMDMESKKKINELREEIGLPVVRGKDAHVNDDFYKYLVRRIYFFDVFHIFGEYDRVLGQIPEDLSFKIDQVKNLINTLLNGGLNIKERYEKYHEFVEEHMEEWNVFDYRRE